jgi:hypothetical protein
MFSPIRRKSSSSFASRQRHYPAVDRSPPNALSAPSFAIDQAPPSQAAVFSDIISAEYEREKAREGAEALIALCRQLPTKNVAVVVDHAAGLHHTPMIPTPSKSTGLRTVLTDRTNQSRFTRKRTASNPLDPGPGKVPRRRSRSSWQAKFDELSEFQKTHGHCLVPPSGTPALYRWVDTQRALCVLLGKGQHNHLNADRLARLNAIGFVWSASDARWTARYHDLLQYKKTHGHCCVPRRYPPNRSLGYWVANQREAYKNS